MSRRLRHNDVVMVKKHDGWAFYGRVWRRLDEDHVVVIDCGKNVIVYADADLERHDYKGHWRWNREPDNDRGNIPLFDYMTSLRQLKRMASCYNAHFGGSRYIGKPWPEADIEAAEASLWQELADLKAKKAEAAL